MQYFKIKLKNGEQLKFLKEQMILVNQNKLQKLLWILGQVTETSPIYYDSPKMNVVPYNYLQMLLE